MIQVDRWSPADGLTLEPNALRAATEQLSSLALTAGPGAGKTEMLAQRADFLLSTGTCRYPKRILAISFKVDASKNLKERVLARCGSDLASRFDSYTFHAFAKRIIDRFRPVLTGEDSLNADYAIGERRVTYVQITFNDIVPLANQILKSSSMARNAIRQTYSDVFLDEFQDCTNLQYELVRLAFQETGIRLTAVGDTKQKIMAWAGALDGIFEKFVGDFAATPLNMYRNFRSLPRLLRMQNEIVRILDPASGMPEEQLAGEEGEVHIWSYEDSRDEAEHLASQIAHWIKNEGVALSEIAVLVSKQLDLYADHLMVALEDRGIPFRNEQQLQDISTEPGARLIVDYLSCVYGQREPKAWIRLTNLLTPFSDEDTRSTARQNFQNFVKGQRDTVFGGERDGGYHDWWQRVRDFLNEVGLDVLSSLSPDYESSVRLNEVILETKKRIEEIFKIENDLPSALKRFSDDQAVRILTIHKSKGLEFDSVVILGVEKQTFWGKIDDERSAYFVGISRAKRRLILTTCNRRETPPSNPYRWQERRSPHGEFLSYAQPFLNQ